MKWILGTVVFSWQFVTAPIIFGAFRRDLRGFTVGREFREADLSGVSGCVVAARRD